MSTTFDVSPSAIIEHRANRKRSGMVGCITGKPVPEINFYGFSDVQSWRPADPMEPHCFCFDCRELWDSDGTIDAQLVNNGHEWACQVYRSILNAAVADRQTQVESALEAAAPAPTPLALPLPSLAHSRNSTGFFWARPGCPCSTCTEEIASADQGGLDPRLGAAFSALPAMRDLPERLEPEPPVPLSLPPRTLQKTPSGRFILEVPADEMYQIVRYLKQYSSNLHKKMDTIREDLLTRSPTTLPPPPPEFDEYSQTASAIDTLVHSIEGRMT